MSRAPMQNPMKNDPELKAMLEKLDFVKTARVFRRWKNSFLNRLESFLEDAGITAARQAYTDFGASMGKFVPQVAKVEEFVEKGELTPKKYTVKARNCLNEMAKMMTEVIEEKDSLIPSTGALEKQRGYNKFHMGAVLVKDDFEEYGRLTSCADILQHMRNVSLGEVADKQVLEEMDNYSVKLQKFCDVMADLGLYEVMLKCREFAVEDDNYLDDLIFLDMKTGSIGCMDREDVVSKRLVSVVGKDKEGYDIFSEAAIDDEAQEKLLKMVKDNHKLGIGFGTKNNLYDEESVGISNADQVASMWGVTLRKTPKNKKGEELVFICQRTGQFGEISRKLCIGNEVLTETKDAKGNFTIGEAEHDFNERADLVEQIRRLLKLGVAPE